MSPATPIQVLLVEDNPGDARLTRALLAEAGGVEFVVAVVDRLAAGLAHLAAERCDVVLLDLSLPDSHGLEGVARVQAARPELPVVVLTGLEDTSIFSAAVAAGAQDFLVKGRGDGETIARAIRYSIERKRAQMQLLAEKDRAEQANRSKSQFLANMSHELRTPLNAIIGFSEIMSGELMGPLGNDAYRDYARDIRESGKHLLAIINDILDLSKIEAGQLQIHEGSVDLARVAKSCFQLLAETAARGGVALRHDLPPKLPMIRGDERMLKQVFLNLLSNAVKFTPEGGAVTLAAEVADDLVVTVADTGIGIDEADIDRVLTPFMQVDSSLSRKYEGTGLGLPLAASFTRLHGGALALRSKLGEGTVVTVRLPANRLLARAA